MSKDGEKRITLKVDYRLTAEDIAVLIVSKHCYDINDTSTPEAFLEQMSKLSTRKLLEFAKDELYDSGAVSPAYRVGDNKLEGYAAAILDLIKQRIKS
jgi:hypothetical protein